MDITLIIALLFLFYVFIGYPIIVWFLAATTKQPNTQLKKSDQQPELTVVLAVHNGEKLVQQRIENIFASDYQNIKKMIVVSDGSTDETNNLVESLKASYPAIELITYQPNRGKAYAVNQALQQVTTELVAFCDVRQKFKKDTLTKLQQALSVDKVGVVTGNLQFEYSDHTQADPGLYWRYESWIRLQESRYRSLLGVSGAIYMAKTALLPKQMPADAILDDMFMPLSVAKQGYEVKFVADAIAIDVPSQTVKEEFNRKVRTLAGNFQLMGFLPWLNHPTKNPLFFQWISHKVARLLVPYALMIVLLTSGLSETLWVQAFFGFQLLGYGYLLLSYWLMKQDKKLPLASFLVSFFSLQVAAFVAGIKTCTTPAEQLWQKH